MVVDGVEVVYMTMVVVVVVGGDYHVGLQRDAWREDDDVEERLCYTALNHVSMFCVYT